MDVKWKKKCSLCETWKNTLHGGVPLDPSPFTLTVKILTQELGSKLRLALMYQTLCPFELLIVHNGGLCWTRGCILGSFPHVFRGRTCRTNLGLLTQFGSKRFPGRSRRWEEPLSETPDLREGSHSGCGANGILVGWLSGQRASGSGIEHIYLRKKNVHSPQTFLWNVWLKKILIINYCCVELKVSHPSILHPSIIHPSNHPLFPRWTAQMWPFTEMEIIYDNIWHLVYYSLSARSVSPSRKTKFWSYHESDVYDAEASNGWWRCFCWMGSCRIPLKCTEAL